MPFDRFMEVALYDPVVGYYARPRPRFGADGDFYTAPRTSRLFARAFAERIRAERARLGAGRPFLLVEVGPGDGELLDGILESLGPDPAVAPDLEVCVVERTDARARETLERVRPRAEAHGIAVRSAESVASVGLFEGVVVANELLDAQPLRRLERSVSGWSELGVRIEGVRLVPARSDRIRPVGGAPLPDSAEPGTILECSPSAEGLVREVADHLVRGVFLVDDYGMDEAEMIAGHPRGTLQVIHGHREGEDPLARPGASDLSAFVNFSRIRYAAARAGFAVRSDVRQAEALAEWGIARLLEDDLARSPGAEEQVRLRLAAKSLLFGFERFRVLELVAGAPRPFPAT